MTGDNPFEVAVSPTHGTVQVEETRAAAEVKAQVFMARQFPRDPVKATDRILAECDRHTLAEKAIYSYPRGGTQVSGPSIRLAEAVARGWGNLAFGVVEVDRIGDESSMLAYAWDLETNTMSRKEFKTAHVRDTKEGRKALRDERDVYELTANQGARRVRSCILSLIPGDIVDAAVARCQKTLTAKVGKIEEVIPAMVEKFKALGVTKTMIEKRLRHRIEATQASEVVQLGSVYTSITDGMGTIQDYFEMDGSSISEQIDALQAEFTAILTETIDGTSIFQTEDRDGYLKKRGKIAQASAESLAHLQGIMAGLKADAEKKRAALKDILGRGKANGKGNANSIL